MMLVKCGNCEFFVGQRDEICPNCGRQNPSEISFHSEKRDFSFSITALGTFIFTVLLTAVTAAVTYSQNPEKLLFNTGFALVSGLVLGAVFFGFIALYLDSRAKKIARRLRNSPGTRETLCHKEDQIYERLAQLAEESNYLDGNLISDVDEEQKSSAEYETVSRKFKLVECETAICELQLREIKLARLKNGFSAFQKNINQLDAGEIEEGLQLIEEKLEEVEPPEEINETGAEDELDKKILIGEKAFFDNCSRVRGAAETLREALLRRQNFLARGAVPVAETLTALPGSGAPSETLSETFNLRAELTDFSELFEELDREYELLEAAEASAKKHL